MSDPSRREFTRLSINMHATLAAAGATLFCPETRGVSLRGMYAYSATPLPAGTQLAITLRFGGPGALAIDLEGQVVDADEAGMGIEFTAMSIEALHHMRNLLLHNAPDPGRIEDEFHAHVGLKRP